MAKELKEKVRRRELVYCGWGDPKKSPDAFFVSMKDFKAAGPGVEVTITPTVLRRGKRSVMRNAHKFVVRIVSTTGPYRWWCEFVR